MKASSLFLGLILSTLLITNRPAMARTKTIVESPILPRVTIEDGEEKALKKRNSHRHVLYIGDSQTTITPLGELLKSFIQEEFNYSVTLASAAGSSPRHWGAIEGEYKDWLCSRNLKYLSKENISLDSELVCEKHLSPFENLIERHNPSIVLFQFLGNSVRFHDKPSELKRFVYQLLLQIPKNTECLWITSPPAENPDNNVARLATQTQIEELLVLFANEYGRSCELISGLNEITLAEMVESDSYYIDGFHLSSMGADYFLVGLKTSLKRFFSSVR